MCVYISWHLFARAREDATAIASFARTLHALSRSSLAGNFMNERSEKRTSRFALSVFFSVRSHDAIFSQRDREKLRGPLTCISSRSVNWNISSPAILGVAWKNRCLRLDETNFATVCYKAWLRIVDASSHFLRRGQISLAHISFNFKMRRLACRNG